METITVNLYDPQSVAQLILSKPMKKWKRWMLEKLLPKEFFEIPTQQLMKLQKGSVIGKVSVEVSTPDYNEKIDIGCGEDAVRALNIGVNRDW